MNPLIERFLQDHGSEVAQTISDKLGIAKEQAARVLPSVAPLLVEDLQRGTGGGDGPAAAPDASASAGPSPADPELLSGETGEKAADEISRRLGVSREQAAQVIPLLVPVAMSFLLKQRVSPGAAAAARNLMVSLLRDERAAGLVQSLGGYLKDQPWYHKAARAVCQPEGKPPLSPAARLGRLAGQFFPGKDKE